MEIGVQETKEMIMMFGYDNKQIGIGKNLTGLVGKKMAIVALVILSLMVCSVSMLSGGESSIGGYSADPAPTAFKVVASTDGAISIFAPANTPGHWEIGGEFFSDQSVVLFCPMERVGIKKYTFIPTDPTRCKSSVYAIMCRFMG